MASPVVAIVSLSPVRPKLRTSLSTERGFSVSSEALSPVVSPTGVAMVGSGLILYPVLFDEVGITQHNSVEKTMKGYSTCPIRGQGVMNGLIGGGDLNPTTGPGERLGECDYPAVPRRSFQFEYTAVGQRKSSYPHTFTKWS